jgi:hypothetical protein
MLTFRERKEELRLVRVQGQYSSDSRWCMNKPMPPRLAASCVLRDPDRDRHTEACHPVDDVACYLRFGPLTGQNPSVETPANNGLVAIYRGLNQAPTAVARTALPGDASMLRYRRQMSVPPLPHPQHQSREAGSCSVCIDHACSVRLAWAQSRWYVSPPMSAFWIS